MPFPAPEPDADLELRSACLRPLLEPVATRKAALTLALPADLPVDCARAIADPGGIPGRPARPQLVAHTSIKPPPLSTPRGVAALLHSITHIELNAIDLALDICWRFAGAPEAFYRDWLRIAKEEATHFMLLRDHMVTLGHDYGDFDAHNALWEMAERTRGDLLARIALVPRTLEARGLDASPAVKRKLVGAGDRRAGEILDIILRDEIGHVATGNQWFHHFCAEQGLEPVATYAELAARYQAPATRRPLNLEARRQAGFTPAELDALERTSI